MACAIDINDDERHSRIRKLSSDRACSSTSKRFARNRLEIPVRVVEDHNDALPCIYRLIGSKHIPFDHLTLLHFDAHSDLSVPQKLNVNLAFNKEELFNATSIENWIIPMIYGGHINQIIWIKPFWSQQTFRTESTFCVGKHVETSKIRVTSTDSYFLSEASFAPEDQLVDCKQCSLLILTVDDEKLPDDSKENHAVAEDANEVTGNTGPSEKCSMQEVDRLEQMDKADILSTTNHLHKVSQLLPSGADAPPFILDIDLDFFSTTDPFRAMLTEEQYHLLAKVYHFTPPLDTAAESIVRCASQREEQLSYLESIMKTAQAGQVPQLGDNPRDQQLSALFHAIKSPPCGPSGIDDDAVFALDPSFDYEWLHEIGTGIDDTGLPHHISSHAEINYLVDQVAGILRGLPRPAAIMIARSTTDDYCPLSQIEYIQNSVLSMLKSVYSGQLDIEMKYEAVDQRE